VSKLTTQQRNSLPKSEFAVPSERRFPIPDKAHAIAAKRLIGQAHNLSSEQKVNIIKMANAKLSGGK
jgi:hypothetical protein